MMIGSCPLETPYCDQGACVATTKSAECAALVAPAPAITCTAVGFFPDVVDCQKYYYCAAGAEVGSWNVTSYVCPLGFAYNFETNTCEESSERCRTFTCVANQMVTYRPNPAYYGYCSGNTPVGMSIFKCPDTKHMIYNLNTFACEFNCEEDGYFPDVLDEARYYHCIEDNGVFTSSHGVCPGDLVFREDHCQEKTPSEKKLDTVLTLLEQLIALISTPAPVVTPL